MLNKEQCIQLEKSAMEQINKLYTNDDANSKLAKVLSNLAVKSTIITLQEYEKLNKSQPN